MRRQRELEQAVCPVALVLLGRQVLQFASQRYLRRELVLGVGDVDVGVHGSAVPFDNGLIVLLVDVHQAELECLRELSRQREVEAAIECFVAPLEELRAVAVGLCDEVFCIVELPVDSTDIGKIGFHVHAVASAEQRFLLEVIAHFCLISPFAVGELCGIGIDGGQRVGLVLREGRQVIDGRRDADGFRGLASTLERHVFRPFCLQQDAQPFLGVRARQHDGRAFPVDVVVGKRRVGAFLRVLGQHVPCAFIEAHPHIPGIDELRESQAIEGREIYLLVVFLEPVDPGAAQRDTYIFLLPRRKEFSQAEFGVCAADERLVPVPITALHTREGFQRNAIHRLHHNATAEQAVVDAERALFVCAEDEAGAELLVERACRQLHLAQLALHPKVRHAPALEVFLEAG